MASLFPVDNGEQARPSGDLVQPDAADRRGPVQQSFSSFNAAEFLLQQQQPSSVHQEGLRGALLGTPCFLMTPALHRRSIELDRWLHAHPRPC